MIFIRVSAQTREEIHFLPLGFAFGHLADQSNHFRFTFSSFQSWNISPILEEKVLCPIRTLTNAHAWVLSSSARHALASPPRWNWRLEHNNTSGRICLWWANRREYLRISNNWRHQTWDSL